jgi:hypothetical protein
VLVVLQIVTQDGFKSIRVDQTSERRDRRRIPAGPDKCREGEEDLGPPLPNRALRHLLLARPFGEAVASTSKVVEILPKVLLQTGKIVAERQTQTGPPVAGQRYPKLRPAHDARDRLVPKSAAPAMAMVRIR